MADEPAPRVMQKTHNTMSTESLRQRQLDRLAPRGVPARDARVTTAAREVQDAVDPAVKLAAPPRAKQLGRAKTEGGGRRIKRLNEDAIGPQSAHNRPERAYGDDYTVESASAGKGGRPFTVSNVGNNGRIYLRPSIRSAHQRYQQPQFVFPPTPPTAVGLDALLASNPEGISYTNRTPTTTPSLSTTPVKYGSYISTSKTATAPTNRHRRAHSYSTVDEQHGAIQDSDIGAFKVVIERPSPDCRPKTSGGQNGTPALEVPIPSHKLGTPRFSIRGTPFMYGSSYAGTEVEYRSSFMSQTEADIRARSRRSSLPKGPFSARQSITSHPGDMESTYELRLPPTGMCGTSPNLMSKQMVVPEMFDALTFLPQCEDRSVIRRMTGTDLITSATPARLVAEVTQELSYDLVASFFITYRSYISGSDLLALVMARLQWGIDRIVDGLIVTVRCFTVIRHWLVNFFADDFVLDYDLRVQFCNLVNSMVKKHALLQTNSKTTNDILSNIKRLWRDSCAVYWDGPEFAYDLDALVPIAPGGIAGSRDPRLTPKFWEELASSKTPRFEPEESQFPALDLETEHDSPISSTHRFFASIPLEYPAEFDRVRQHQAAAIVSHQSHLSSESVAPQSIMSVEALSCSIPPLSKSGQVSAGTGMAAHPVFSTSQAGSNVPVAHAPKVIRPRSYRPGQGFQRHRSVSNSSRPDRTQEAYAKEVVSGDAELTFVNRFAGSLVRGLVFLPGQAYLPVDDPANSRPASVPNKKASSKPDAAQTSHGMKRMFGTVRRAVVTKAENKSELSPKSPTQIIFPHLSLPPDQHATYLHGPTDAPQWPLQNPRKPVIMRPDKLSQFVESDFEKVVMQHKEDVAKDHDRSEPWVRRINVDTGSDFLRRSIDKTTLAACTTPLPELQPDPEDLTGIRDNTSFLFDGARDGDAPGHPDNAATMSGALPTHTSTDAVINVFNGQSVVPTPPVTPPERFLGSSRHPSRLLGGSGPSSIERTPSLALDSRSPQSDLEERSQFKPLRHPSISSYGKVYKPRRSTSLRRIASFQTSYTRHMSELSFDATTFSDSGGRTSMISTHAPGNRVLRRRPGGDLRALRNVGELPLRRHRSSGSLTTYSDSMRSSYLLDRESAGYVNVASIDDMPQESTHTFSLGALADPESIPRPHISVFSTSSKPAMRPSFQAEAAKLAQIPDDVDDDGGVESALLKLEGKYEQRNSSQSISQNFIALAELDFEHAFKRDSGEETEKRRHRDDHVIEQTFFDSRRASEVNELGEHSYGAEEYELQPTVYQPPPESFSLSRDSQNSIPLLERDYSQYETDDRDSRNWTLNSEFRGPSHERNTEGHHNSQPSQTSIDFVHRTESLNSIPAGETIPRYMSANESFLQTEDDNISDLSSEMSLEVISATEFPGNISTNAFPPIQPGTIITEIAIPSTSRVSHGPSMTIEQALSMSPGVKQSAGALPLTPDVTPTYSQPSNNLRSWYSDDQLDAHQRQNIAETIFNGPLYVEDHMPFILYFDSNLIAQQFTLIEKETLGEIHFKELLEMKWCHEAASASQSWPRFLQSLKKMEENDTVSHGIEICGARSSIMTQWAISQIILTKNITERSRTIAKLIHIAMHCRKLGNYATLFQLTIALSNQLIAELHETWSHVPAADVQSLREFEELIQPANNFHRLRDEMESVLGKRACIPLVAIYAKDLTALKDMPSYIASTPTDPPLINVSKCRAQAAVVQLFSRYLESSTGYRFQTVPGLTERCLWIAGLSQAEIRGHAERLV